MGVGGLQNSVLVFEDAVAGVRAGKAAGATVIAIIETYSCEDLILAGADYVVNGLDKVRVVDGNDTRITLEIEVI